MPNLLPNGIGGLVADELITAKNLQLSSPARIWYVDSATGDNANSGKDRKYPKATINGALAAFSGNDNIIVCMENHAEEVGAVIEPEDRIEIVGEGATAGVPTVELTMGPGSHHMFDLGTSGDGSVAIRNIRFRPPGNAAAPGNTTGNYIRGDVPHIDIIGCYFDFDEYSQAEGIRMGPGADGWSYQNCVFTNVDDTEPVVARPRPAIAILGPGALRQLDMCGCTFDGGIHGFDDGSQNPFAFDGSIEVINQVRVLRMSLLRGADFKLHADSTGRVEVALATGHAKVEW